MFNCNDLANRVLGIVADVTEVEIEVIISKVKTEEAVDARHITVKLLHEASIYPKKIARIMGMTVRNVNHILTRIEDRLRYSRPMRNNYEKSRRLLGNSWLAV